MTHNLTKMIGFLGLSELGFFCCQLADSTSAAPKSKSGNSASKQLIEKMSSYDLDKTFQGSYLLRLTGTSKELTWARLGLHETWLTSWAYRTPKVRELKMVQKDSHATCHQHWLGKFGTSRKTIAKPQGKHEDNQITQEVLGLLSTQRCMIQRIRKRIVIFHNNRNQTVNRFKSCLI